MTVLFPHPEGESGSEWTVYDVARPEIFRELQFLPAIGAPDCLHLSITPVAAGVSPGQTRRQPLHPRLSPE